MTTPAQVQAMDEADALAGFRERFHLPRGLVYLDGNSLGPLPIRTQERIARVAAQEWGDGLINSWESAGWIDAPSRIGDKIARLIGAGSGEVLVADSTSINLFKCLAAALAMQPGRTVMLSESGNFPTDLYMMQGLAGLTGTRYEVVPADRLLGRLDESIAVLTLTHVNYRSAAIHDLAAITRAAHDAGALVAWDLSHSVGSVPVDLESAGVDFAVGCGYKFLNGGPGAPAFVYVARRHQALAPAVLSGWLGHREPFAFDETYQPDPGIGRFRCGTPPILSLMALEEGVDLLLEADQAALRRKQSALSRLFIELVDSHCEGLGFTLASPREDERRGGHVSLRHPHGFAIMQALKARGVIGDFRGPDILRFGIAPLYLSFGDMYEAVTRLVNVMREAEWRRPEFNRRASVT
ncbi:MAG: kynureninase [Steroidobacteraceae bacterium]